MHLTFYFQKSINAHGVLQNSFNAYTTYVNFFRLQNKFWVRKLSCLNNQNLHIISFSDCAVTMTQLLGVITSPGFPHLYRNGIDCTWNIQLQIGQLINITFLHFALDNYWTFNTEYTEEEW